MAIQIVAATTRKGGIGNEGGLPWGKPIHADMMHFKQVTDGKMVVMGRKTWESIPEKYRPLPDRDTNIIFTRDRSFKAPGATLARKVGDVLLHAKFRDVLVIGGGEIYAMFEPYATRMHLTYVEGDFPADTYFPAFDRTAWKESSGIFVPQDESNPHSLQFVTLERISPTA